jgi:hypothetical protein
VISNIHLLLDYAVQVDHIVHHENSYLVKLLTVQVASTEFKKSSAEEIFIRPTWFDLLKLA